jgi:hypothetical protein
VSREQLCYTDPTARLLTASSLVRECRCASPSMTFVSRILTAVLVTCAFSLAGVAQQSPPPPSTTPPPGAQSQSAQPPQGDAASQQKTGAEILKEEEHQRMLGVVPMFGTTNYRNAPPLTPAQKFHLMAKTAIDPFTWFAAGAQAGISQAENEFGGYGQGAAGYGKRYGATYTDSFDSNFFSNFFYPVLFRQDPRYFRLGQGSTVKQRIGSALKQEFVARKDSGGHTFHFSNVLGAFTAGGISNAYYPKDDRGFGLTVSRSMIALGYGCLGDIVVEFWPDIDRKLFHRGGGGKAQRSDPPGAGPN